jgi:hypothetical protein
VTRRSDASHLDSVAETTSADCGRCGAPCSIPQNLVHGLSLGQLIHELVEVANVSHEVILDVLHANAADEARDLGDVRVDPWGAREESFEIYLFVDLILQRLFIVAGEPVDDVMQFLPGTSLLLDLGELMRVDAGEGHSKNSGVVHELIAPQGTAFRLLWIGYEKIDISTPIRLYRLPCGGLGREYFWTLNPFFPKISYSSIFTVAVRLRIAATKSATVRSPFTLTTMP